MKWQYIKVNDELAMGVSYNAMKAPVNSIAFLEKKPCINYREINVQSDKNIRKWRMITDPVNYVEKCDDNQDDERYVI